MLTRSIEPVVVLCWSAPGPSDRAAQKIAAFLGTPASLVTLSGGVVSSGVPLGELVPKCNCLIVDADTLANAADAMPAGAVGLNAIADIATNVFVQGFQPNGRHDALIRALSSDGFVAIGSKPAVGTKYRVAADDPEQCGHLSGLCIDTVERDHFFQPRDLQNRKVLIWADDQPFMVRQSWGGSRMFLAASSSLADLDEPMTRRSDVLSRFSRLGPVMMFLKSALGPALWHTDAHRACLIVDDPLLHRRYGFLQFSHLVERMRARRFSACLAFIPWNYRRSKADVAALFASNDGTLGICVHGADHTQAEFEGSDVQELKAKAELALERMVAHRELTGVPFADVMVFPQGLFSPEALSALDAAGYLAAINSSVCPSTGEPLKLWDLLEVAVTTFADFPLFGRRYPRDMAHLAFDLFLGKPALTVEHHEFFRNGCDDLEAFVARLTDLEPRIEWAGVATICARASLMRTRADGQTDVRFYTSRFELVNTHGQLHTFRLMQRRDASQPPPRVTVNDLPCLAEFSEGWLNLQVVLAAGETAVVKLSPARPTRFDRTTVDLPLQKARVWCRRHLSEFRDNYVTTNRVLSAMLGWIRSARLFSSERRYAG